MLELTLQHPADVDSWRHHARRLLQTGVPPEEVVWQARPIVADLFAQTLPATSNVDGIRPTTSNTIANTSKASSVEFKVPKSFLPLAKYVACHSAEDRYALLYKVLYRLTNGEPDLLKHSCDDDVHRLEQLRKNVARDRHKMTAFVRFRRQVIRGDTHEAGREHYLAWFEPEHHIVRLSSEFFRKRFCNMRWSILTPEESAHWDGTSMIFADGGERDSLPDSEIMEELWCTYFSNIFNPARLRINAMQSEMPVKYWKNLPEAPLIASLINEAGSRTRKMLDTPAGQVSRFAKKAEHPANRPIDNNELPPAISLKELRTRANNCRRCAHSHAATQLVFGRYENSVIGNAVLQKPQYLPSVLAQDRQAQMPRVVMMVGEQPGDREDIEGRPFTGPAGQLLRSILSELDADMQTIYMTNAVKHFKYKVRGRKRLHQRPAELDIAQCQYWLLEEIRLVKPTFIIALGASAAKALLGRPVVISEERGHINQFSADTQIMITSHPAYVLRCGDKAAQQTARQALRNDLLKVF